MLKYRLIDLTVRFAVHLSLIGQCMSQRWIYNYKKLGKDLISAFSLFLAADYFKYV